VAVSEKLDCYTFPAGGDLSTKQYYVVKASSGNAVVVTSGSDVPLGVLQNDPAALGRAATIARGGISKCVAAASIVNGATVEFTAAGKVQTLASGTKLGIAQTAAGADGDIVSVLLQIL